MTEIEGKELLHEEPAPLPVKALRRSLSFVNKLMLSLNAIFALLLLLSIFARYVSPAVFWPMAFIGLGFLPLLAINLLFVLWWLIQWRKFSFISLGIMLISLPTAFQHFAVTFGKSTVPSGKNAFTVVSYNTKLFDLYNWSKNKETRQHIFELLGSQHPDLLCLQEFYNEDTGNLRNLDTLRDILGFDTAHVEYTVSLRKTDHWGIVTFSKWPIVNSGRITFNNKSNNLCIYTDVIMSGDTVRIYNMHLQSIHFGYADYESLRKIGKGIEPNNEIEASKSMLRRLKTAFIRRAGQAENIRQHIDSCPYPVIVCGDFNDTPCSYSYHTIGSNLHDAFDESGNGTGQSFVSSWPVPRIDYILHSKHFGAADFHVLPEPLSDHYPLVTTMWKK